MNSSGTTALRGAAILVAALAMAESSGFTMPILKPCEPKNKFNLTDEQIELMATMTPKQKKTFLKLIRTTAKGDE